MAISCRRSVFEFAAILGIFSMVAGPASATSCSTVSACIFGSNTSSAAWNGIGTDAGVFGKSLNGDGVDAQSTNGHAVVAQSYAAPYDALVASNEHNILTGEFGAGAAIEGMPALFLDTWVKPGSISDTFDIGVYNVGAVVGTNVFNVNSAGDVHAAGSISSKSLNLLAPTRNGSSATTFSPKGASPTIEDTGTAQLVAGSASVRLDPTFAASVDTSVPYRVFLTPDGDTRGLFVGLKTPTGFVVRESQGGRSTVAFDYRIVATGLGDAGKRMAVAAEPNHSIRWDTARRPSIPVRPYSF
jgi:hypothetical protein